MPDIHIQEATLYYHKKPLFQDLNLILKEHQCTCILGQSGVGKSSLLRLIAGLEPDSRVQIEPSIKNQLSYLAQDSSLLPWLSVKKNITLPSTLARTPAHSIDTLLSTLNLQNHAHLKPHQLSGGQKQRAVLARVLYENKPVLLMDEPFSALDAITRYEMQNILIHNLESKTILFITHDPMEALRIADTLYIMQDTPARLSLFATLTQKKPRDSFDPALQLLHARLLETLLKANQSAA